MLLLLLMMMMMDSCELRLPLLLLLLLWRQLLHGWQAGKQAGGTARPTTRLPARGRWERRLRLGRRRQAVRLQQRRQRRVGHNRRARAGMLGLRGSQVVRLLALLCLLRLQVRRQQLAL